MVGNEIFGIISSPQRKQNVISHVNIINVTWSNFAFH